MTALSIVLTRNAGSLGSVVAIGGATLAVTGSLWWLWRREQSVQPSPMSEYLAVAYGWAYYTSLVFIWESVGDRWVDWLVILPPNFFRASDRQKARPHVCTSISHIRSHRVRRSPSRCGRLHRRCSVPGPHRARSRRGPRPVDRRSAPPRRKSVLRSAWWHPDGLHGCAVPLKAQIGSRSAPTGIHSVCVSHASFVHSSPHCAILRLRPQHMFGRVALRVE